MPSADERHPRLPPPLPLQRPHLRATPDERRIDDTSLTPSSSRGSVAHSYAIPLLPSMAIIECAVHASREAVEARVWRDATPVTPATKCSVSPGRSGLGMPVAYCK